MQFGTTLCYLFIGFFFAFFSPFGCCCTLTSDEVDADMDCGLCIVFFLSLSSLPQRNECKWKRIVASVVAADAVVIRVGVVFRIYSLPCLQKRNAMHPTKDIKYIAPFMYLQLAIFCFKQHLCSRWLHISKFSPLHGGWALAKQKVS